MIRRGPVSFSPNSLQISAMFRSNLSVSRLTPVKHQSP